MAIVDIEYLKEQFKNLERPDEVDFDDLIDTLWTSSAGLLLTGSGNPDSELGKDGDLYFDLDIASPGQGNVWEKVAGTWVLRSNLKTGVPGPQGEKGDKGDDGSMWYDDSGAPSDGVGVDGDYYLNNDNGDVYNKITESWVLTGNIEGPQGEVGPIQDATESQRGQAELATQTEVDSGVDDERIVTPLKFETNVKKRDVASFTRVVSNETATITISHTDGSKKEIQIPSSVNTVTGVIEYAGTTQKTYPTVVTVGAGSGYVVDLSSNPSNPSVTRVDWAAQDYTLGAGSFHHLGVNISGTVVEKSNSYFTESDTHDIIIISKVGLGPAALVIKDHLVPSKGQSYSFYNWIRIVGAAKVGGGITPSATTKQIDIDSFSIIQPFINTSVDPKNASTEAYPACPDCDFQYIYRDGVGGITINTPAQQDINTTYWDDNTGSILILPNQRWAIQRLFYSNLEEKFYILTPQTSYASYNDAVSAINTETFFLSPFLNNEDTIYMGLIIVKSNSSSLNVDGETLFKVSGLLPRLESGGGAGAGSGIDNHELLEGLLGGTLNEHYHHTLQEYLNNLKPSWIGDNVAFPGKVKSTEGTFEVGNAGSELDDDTARLSLIDINAVKRFEAVFGAGAETIIRAGNGDIAITAKSGAATEIPDIDADDIQTLLMSSYSYDDTFFVVQGTARINIQIALTNAKINGGGTVVIPPAQYYLDGTALIISSNTKVIAYGAEIFRDEETMDNMMRTEASGDGAWGSVQNVIIEGGKWNGGTGFVNPCTMIGFFQATNILVLNAEFLGEIQWHYLEINSTRNAWVQNCKFHDGTLGNSNSEAVQIDLAGSVQFPWETGVRNFDGTMCKNINIDNCHFETLSSGIGTHSFISNGLHRKISVTNCKFIDCDRYSVRGIGWSEAKVIGNTIENVENIGIYIEHNNTIGSSAFIEGTVISGNSIYNCAYRAIWINDSYQTDISIKNIRGIMVVNNVIFNPTSTTTLDIGIIIERSTDIICNDNVVRNFKESGAGIDIYQCIGGVVDGNYCVSDLAVTSKRGLILGASSGSSDTANFVISNNTFTGWLLRAFTSCNFLGNRVDGSYIGYGNDTQTTSKEFQIETGGDTGEAQLGLKSGDAEWRLFSRESDGDFGIYDAKNNKMRMRIEGDIDVVKFYQADGNPILFLDPAGSKIYSHLDVDGTIVSNDRIVSTGTGTLPAGGDTLNMYVSASRGKITSYDYTGGTALPIDILCSAFDIDIDGTKEFEINSSGQMVIPNIPTSNPGGSGIVWSDGGILKIT